jgi:hypothetical protein
MSLGAAGGRLLPCRRWMRAGLCAMLPVVLCSGLQAQGVEGELQEVAERLAAAQRAQLDLISPRNYERASERLADARERRRPSIPGGGRTFACRWGAPVGTGPPHPRDRAR